MTGITYTLEHVPSACLLNILTIAADGHTKAIHTDGTRVFNQHTVTLEGTSIKTILAVQRVLEEHHQAQEAQYEAAQALYEQRQATASGQQP